MSGSLAQQSWKGLIMLDVQVCMTIDNLHERRSGCSSIRLAPNVSLQAKVQGTVQLHHRCGRAEGPRS